MKNPSGWTLFVLVALASSSASLSAQELTLHNPSFEEGTSADTKIGNWKLVRGPNEETWDRWDQATSSVSASEGKTLLYANAHPAAAVQLLRDHPIQPGKYVFAMDAATHKGTEGVSARGVQIAIYAIPTDDEDETKFALLGEKTLSAQKLVEMEDWTSMEVEIEIKEGSPHIGHFFQINITSDAPMPGAPLPAQVVVDNVTAKRVE